MKVNLTPPVEIATLIQLSLSFICLEYGKRSHCLTDLNLDLGAEFETLD